MKTKKLKILLTNDDGIYASGILSLYHELKKIADITVVSPLEEKSGTGHGITFTSPLRIVEVKRNTDFKGYGINGTPADCVKIGIFEILKEKPDMIVSGINHGPNIASLLFYSGTIAAAMEGAIMGIPSIAVSLDTYNDAPNFKFAATFSRKIIKKIQKEGLPKNTFLNINIPNVNPKKIKGCAITYQGPYAFQEYFIKKKDTRNQPYFWLGMKNKEKNNNPEKGSDMKALAEQKIS
ncbi:5'/3'-nucleotidase SurE, partial [Candidatus Auribacterota bacterium]